MIIQIPRQVLVSRLTSAYKDVRRFWHAFRQPYALNTIDTRYEGRQLAANLMSEEFAEWVGADNEGETIDALADLLYVTLGGVAAAGVHLQSSFSRLPDKLPPLQRAVPDARYYLLKDPYCLPECVSYTQTAAASVADFSMRKYPRFAEYFNAVHAANMSKLWSKAELSAVPEGAGYEQSPGELERFIVKRADGKILKSPGFQHPDPNLYL